MLVQKELCDLYYYTDEQIDEICEIEEEIEEELYEKDPLWEDQMDVDEVNALREYYFVNIHGWKKDPRPFRDNRDDEFRYVHVWDGTPTAEEFAWKYQI